MSWASGNPVMRPGLRYIRQEKGGKPTYIVKDPLTLKYYRFGTVEVWLMQHMDGSRSCTALAACLREEFGLNASAESIESFVTRLRELSLAERDARERSAMLVESLRRQRRVRLQPDNNTLMRMRFSFGDPDRLLERMVHAMPFMWSRGFVALSVTIFACYGLLLVTHWGPFAAGLAELYNPANFTPALLGSIYLTGTGIFLVHELGHGLTCKRFGGEVHEMGAMLFYFSPAFFCNVNDAWMFEKRSHRLWVTFAGGWIQLILAAIAGLVWITTEPGTAVHRIAFLCTLLGGGLSVLINFNPLIPLDGYYALVDWLDMPNLRPRAFAFLGALLKRRVLRMDVPVPAATSRERRILLTYAVLAAIYTTLILTLVLVYTGRLFVSHLGGWGWALWALLVWRVTRRGRHVISHMLGVWWTGSHSNRRARRYAVAGALSTAVLAAFLLLVPWTVHVPATVVVEPVQRAWLRAPAHAQLAVVHVREGERIAQGQAVAVLRDDELEVALREARAEVSRLETARGAAQGRRDVGGDHVIAAALDAAHTRVRALERRHAALTLRAPFDAVIATPRLDARIGEQVEAGSVVAEIWGGTDVRGRVILEQRDAGAVSDGTPLAIRFAAFPAWTWRTRVARVESASRQLGSVEAIALLPLDDSAPALRPGMTGRGSLAVGRTTPAGALLRAARRVISLDLLL